MSSRIASVALSSKVREYATGAAQSASSTLSLADFIAPSVPVATSNFNYMVYDLQNRFRIPDAERAIGGQATQVQTGGTETNGKLKPYALDYPVDEFEESAASDEDIEMLYMEGADVTAQLGALSWSKKVIDLALTTAGGGTDLSLATANIDFTDEVNGKIIDVVKASQCAELCPIKIFYGPNAMRRWKKNLLARGYAVGSGKNSNAAQIKDEDVMSLLMGNPQSRISWATYDSAAEGATAVPTFMLDNSVLIFTGADAPTRVDPSFMKTFRLRNKWMVPGSYSRDDGRVKVLKFDWYALPVVTNSANISRLNFTA